MGNLTIATIFIVLINVLMWFSTIAMVTINPTGTFCYNLEGTIIGETITQTNATYETINNSIIDQMPSASTTTISPGSSTSFIFTDIFNSITSWFKTAPIIKYIYGVVAAPYNILKCMNLPVYFIMGIGTFWYLISLLVFVGYLFGREA